MSDDIAREVWKYSRAKGCTKLVLLVIADDANTEMREGWTSPERMAKLCNCTVRHVYNRLLILEEMGEIEVHEHPNFATTYRIRDYVAKEYGYVSFPPGLERDGGYMATKGEILNDWPECKQRDGDVRAPERMAAILARRPAPTAWEMPAYLSKRRRKRAKQ